MIRLRTAAVLATLLGVGITSCRSEELNENGLSGDKPVPVSTTSYTLDTAKLADGIRPGLRALFSQDGERSPTVATLILNPKTLTEAQGSLGSTMDLVLPLAFSTALEDEIPDQDERNAEVTKRVAEAKTKLACKTGPGNICLDVNDLFGTPPTTVDMGSVVPPGLLPNLGAFNLCGLAQLTDMFGTPDVPEGCPEDDEAEEDTDLCTDLFEQLKLLDGMGVNSKADEIKLNVSIDTDAVVRALTRTKLDDSSSQSMDLGLKTDELGTGVAIPVKLAFADPLTLNIDCDCDSGVYSFSQCADVCKGTEVDLTLFTYYPVNGFSGSGTAKSVTLNLGFVPKNEAETRVKWGRRLFEGGYDFPFDILFRVDAVVADGSADVTINDDLNIRWDLSAQILTVGIINIVESYVLDEIRSKGNEVLPSLATGMLADALSGVLEPLFNHHEDDYCRCGGATCELASDLSNMLTYQKFEWFYGMFGPYGPSTPWGDVENFMGVDEVEAISGNQIRFTLNDDPDHDTVPVDEDWCGETWNMSNKNQDGDPVGDACEECDTAPGTAEDGYGDKDHDGNCDDNDNCPGVANDQHNTNELSESIHTPDLEWGDACDPVPTPSTQPNISEVTAFSNSYDGGWIGWDSFYGIYDNSQLDLTPLGSWSSPEKSTSTFKSVRNVPTHFRFCQNPGDGEIRDDCDAPSNIADFWLDVDERSDRPFHRISIVRLGPGQQRAPHYVNRLIDTKDFYWYPKAAVRGVSHETSYNRTSSTQYSSRRFQWLYEQDYWDWKSNGAVDLQDFEDEEEFEQIVRDGLTHPEEREDNQNPYDNFGTEFGPDRLDGMLWVHADTPVGSDTDNDIGTGVHGQQLANHYSEYTPANTVWEYGIWAVDIPLFDNPLLWPIQKVNPPWDDYKDRFTPSVVFEHYDSVAGLSPASIRATLANGLVSTSLRATLRDGAVWTNQAEPLTTYSGNPIVGLAFSADGRALRDVGVFDSGRMSGVMDVAMGGYEVEFGYNLPFNNANARALSQRGLTSATDALPVERRGFTAVYSRTLDKAFLLGGEDEMGVRSGEIWTGTPGEEFELLRSNIELGDVRSATYIAESDSLVVLDQVGGVFLSRARLITVAGDGYATILGEWPLLGLFDTHYLTADRDGSVILSASSSERKTHILVRLDSENGNVMALARRKGSLAMPPIVRADGYERVIRKGKKDRLKMKANRRLFKKRERELGQWLDSAQVCF